MSKSRAVPKQASPSKGLGAKGTAAGPLDGAFDLEEDLLNSLLQPCLPSPAEVGVLEQA